MGKVKLDGATWDLIVRGGANGDYRAYFSRDHASIEQIEAINWQRPVLSGPCELPAGYGFDVSRIDYAMGTKTYIVSLRVREQYLGDVTGYQAQIDALEADKGRLERDKAALEGQLAEADETAIALFEELEAVQAGKEEQA